MARFVPKLAPGDLLAGRYRIERIIGEGGMSRVYLAEDLKLPGKAWAVKECLTVPGEPVSVAKEVKLLITLNHYRLPRIVDFIDPDRDGYSYIVMDYIQGVPLDQFIRAREGRLPLDLLVRYGLQIAEGLRYLHRHEPPVIHRDVKPANLLVDDKGELRFVDFGIARTFQPAKRKIRCSWGRSALLRRNNMASAKATRGPISIPWARFFSIWAREAGFRSGPPRRRRHCGNVDANGYSPSRPDY